MGSSKDDMNFYAEEAGDPRHLNRRLIDGDSTVDLFPCPAEIAVNFSCQFYKPDWKDKDDIEEVLSERIRHVR